MIVQQFLRWMADAPAPRRAEATSALARAYLYSDLDESEREAALSAMIFLLDDPAPGVRRAMAEALARSEAAPREVVLALMSDLPEVATIVFRHSPVLLDAELVDAVAGLADPIPVAVARRVGLSAPVAAAIAEVGSLPACLALLENEHAEIATFSLTRLVERHGHAAPLREALLRWPQTPIEIRQMLLQAVGDVLRDHPLVRRGLAGNRAEAVVADARERATVALARAADNGEMAALAEHLRQSAQLTPALLLRAVCTGNILLFEAALSLLSGMAPPRVFTVLATGRAASVRALLARAKVPARMHTLFVVAVEVWREVEDEGADFTDPATARQVIEQVLARYQAANGAEVDDLLVMLRRVSSETAREAARAYVARALAA
ncbi:DUF2336 domain-containing protein [Stappia taiwanensis]|uniref:DUF2336 domain-containing protein n=1 Tax=Stappia taiwanensis TaxID=992267 RepID=A0A838XL57_9HYPH|nr:DUF2336 domain-containing protein [Stappia taiwanensis]MBA4610587.1 DUF2336 domain-containing protein [Stappia taiwanensis]GGE83741.1 hypothetical protein GCM10007285_09150 [Stappia taiwanensis]